MFSYVDLVELVYDLTYFKLYVDPKTHVFRID